MKPISDLRAAHQGEDIYVLGAGNSLSYLDRDFFAGRTVISVNNAALVWGITPAYVIAKDHSMVVERNRTAFPTLPIVVSRYHSGAGSMAFSSPDPNIYVFDHQQNAVADFDAERDWPTDPDALVVSWSTITSAMHLAAYMGAATVFMVGHDCGRLGERAYQPGYHTEYPDDDQQILPWLLQIEPQSRAVKLQLVARYDTRIYGLSPFISPDLEGVPFRGTNRINLPCE